MSKSLSKDDDVILKLGTENIYLQDLPYHDSVHHRHVHVSVDDCGVRTDCQPRDGSSRTHETLSEEEIMYEGMTQPASNLNARSFLAEFRRRVLQSGPSGYRQLSGSSPRWTLGLQGWRLGVLVSAIGLFICLLFEIGLLVTALALEHTNEAADILYEGSCNKVKKYTLLTLVPFNLLGTLMIGCSNYVMQVISAPSRREIDNAHNHGEDLNIGISSAQNSRWIAPWKNYVWYIIGLTTIPIHLMLNSVVFATLESNSYDVVIAGPDFLNRSIDQACVTNKDVYNGNGCICCVYRDYSANSSLYDSLDPITCMERYRNPLQGASSNLILVTNGNETMWSEVGQRNNMSTLPESYYPGQLPLVIHSSGLASWTQKSVRGNFSNFDYPGLALPHSLSCVSNWTTSNPTIECDFPDQKQTLNVEKCLSKRTQEHCTMRWSYGILICILCCDLIKMICMVFILRRVVKGKYNVDKDDEIIAVLGDAIASFIERPDETSADRCLVDQKQVRATMWPMTANPTLRLKDPIWGSSIEARAARFPARFGPRPQPWKTRTTRWAMGPSRTRSILFAALFVALFVATAMIFVFSLRSLSDISFQNIWKQGVGKVDPSNVFAIGVVRSSLIGGAVIINLPQLLFSTLYFAYNGLFTCMRAGYEWSQFIDPGGRILRVSTPKPRQRSTYWLSLPWRYSLPLVATSAVLHWLVSQSLFLVKINTYDPDGIHDPYADVAACGFSPMAILLVLVTTTVMLIVVIVFGCRKLKPGIPVVGTCSWAISAACHDEGGHIDATERPLMWDVVKEGDEVVPGHCSITSREVTPLVEGHFYQ